MLNEILSLIKCTTCGSVKLKILNHSIICETCKNTYEVKNNKIFFTNKFFDTQNWDKSELFDFDLFERVKKTNMPNIIHGPKISELRTYLNLNENQIALNLGGGKNKFEKIYNFDLGNYDNVDLIGNLETLPFVDNSVDLVISNSVLEHVENYNKVIDETYRILKPGGFFYLCVPCVSMRHHQIDFRRWTMPGLKKLLNDNNFNIIESGVCRGPEMMIWYALETFMVYRTSPGFLREILRKIIFLLIKNFQFKKIKNNEKEQALAVTNYALAKKN